MPRINRERTSGAERQLAARVAFERERRGWTYEALAKRMSDAGCAMHATAVFKIEKGDPPRRITVNELVALSEVFGIQVGELLLPPALLGDVELADRLEDVEVALRALNAQVGVIEKLVDRAPQRRAALRLLLKELYDDWPELRQLFRYALTGKGKRLGDEPTPDGVDQQRGER